MLTRCRKANHAVAYHAPKKSAWFSGMENIIARWKRKESALLYREKTIETIIYLHCKHAVSHTQRFYIISCLLLSDLLPTLIVLTHSCMKGIGRSFPQAIAWQVVALTLGLENREKCRACLTEEYAALKKSHQIIRHNAQGHKTVVDFVFRNSFPSTILFATWKLRQ